MKNSFSGGFDLLIQLVLPNKLQHCFHVQHFYDVNILHYVMKLLLQISLTLFYVLPYVTPLFHAEQGTGPPTWPVEQHQHN